MASGVKVPEMFMRPSVVFVWVTLLTGTCFGQQRPNFTGTWKQVGLREAERVSNIEHSDPLLTVVTNFKTTGGGLRLGGGYSGKEGYRTDGSEETGTNTGTGRQLWRTVYWEGPALVFLTITKEGYRVAVTRESWTLSGDGKTLTKARRLINMDGVDEGAQIFQKE